MNQSHHPTELAAPQHPTHKESIMKRLALITLLLSISITAAHAASATTLQITFDLTDDIAIDWSTDGSTPASDTTNVWAIGAVALNGSYETNTPHGSIDFAYIMNTSATNTPEEISVQITSAPTNWSQAGTAAANAYTLELDLANAGTFPVDFTTTDTVIAALNLDDNSTNAATGEMDFRFGTPTSLSGTSANGSGLSITITFTAARQ